MALVDELDFKLIEGDLERLGGGVGLKVGKFVGQKVGLADGADVGKFVGDCVGFGNERELVQQDEFCKRSHLQMLTSA